MPVSDGKGGEERVDINLSIILLYLCLTVYHKIWNLRGSPG